MKAANNHLLFAAFLLSSVFLTGCQADPSSNANCGLNTFGSFVEVPSGEFIKSFDPQEPEEGFPQTLTVSGFKIQKHEVTNAQFAEFVEQTGYVTDAEKNLDTAAGGSAFFALPSLESQGGWALVNGATWRSPEGQGSDIHDRTNHPVVHVSYNDARAYAEWAGVRLPSEVEWEYAARLGLIDPNDSNSGAYQADGTPIANTWQGVFPIANLATDGYKSTSPVGCFSLSKIGLADMIGNVWEWTSTPYRRGSEVNYTIKGGSFLCANNFCKRYRPPARQPHEKDFSTNHIGFRVVKDA